jgi:hypothetical protein
MPKCPVCLTPVEYGRSPYQCPRCGDYEYPSGMPWIENPDHQVRLSGWIREQNAACVVPVITQEILRRVIRMRLPGFRERADRALLLIARAHRNVRALINLAELAKEPELLAVTYSQNPEETTLLIDILEQSGYLKWGTTRGSNGHLTTKGLLRAEALGTTGSGSQAFVAMWFDVSMSGAWLSGFEPGIKAAGFRPVRLDDKDYVGGITDEIMAEIRRSRFVVADYTGQRHNVYFEAGFALGLGLTVIPTCRADENDKLEFDIRHLNTLPWKSHTELAEALNKRIRAVIGAGPDADPP